MHVLRSSLSLARLLLAWFVVTVGMASASPMLHPQSMEVVCSAGGAVKVVFTGEDGVAHEGGQHTLDCSLCLTGGAPPPQALIPLPLVQPLGHALRPIVAAQLAARVGAPLPARGPPVFLST